MCWLISALMAALAIWMLMVRGVSEEAGRLGEDDPLESVQRALEGVDLELSKVALRAFEISEHGFRVVQGKRTQSEQDWLYAQGRTRRGPIVTWTHTSKHVQGLALDFLPLDVEGRPTWDPKAFESVAAEFKRAAVELNVGIDWGYDLWKKDLGHIELSRGTSESIN